MQVVRDPADAINIADPELRTLLQKTIAALSEDYPYDPDVLGYFLIVQPGDSLATINAQIGFDILANRWTGIRYDQPGYTQAFEVLEEHAGYFEAVFLIDDSGYGVSVWVTKKPGVDSELRAMCQRYAVPAIA